MQSRDRKRAYGEVGLEAGKWKQSRKYWKVVDEDRTFRQLGRDDLLREKF